MSTLAHESTCEKLRGMPFCTCPVPPQPSSPQQTMTTLQRIESGIGALRGDLDKLMQSHAALETKLDRDWEYQTNLESTRLKAITDARESAMRNHCQVMDALKNLAVALAKPNETERSADGNGNRTCSSLAARRKARDKRK